MVKDNLGGHREGKKILIPPWPGPTTLSPGQLSVCPWVPQVFSRPLSQRTPFLLKQPKKTSDSGAALPVGLGAGEPTIKSVPDQDLGGLSMGPSSFMTACVTLHEVSLCLFLPLQLEIHARDQPTRQSHLNQHLPLTPSQGDGGFSALGMGEQASEEIPGVLWFPQLVLKTL